MKQTKEIHKELEQQEQEVVEKQDDTFKDQFLRVSADFTNYKRRMEKERLIWHQTGQAHVLKQLLDSIDDLQRAIEAGKAIENKDSAWFDGLVLLQKNIQKQLETLGVTQIDCSSSFNPDLHEALVQIDSPDHESGQIIDVIKPGYLLKQVVLRHAQVSVAK